MLMSVLDHDNGAVDHGADSNRDASEAHDVRADAKRLHGGESHQDADRQHYDRDQSTTHVQQEHDADERNDDAFLGERSLQRLDRIVNEIGTIVDRDDLDPLRQRRGHVGQTSLHIVDHIQRVLPEALQRDPAGDLPLSVKLGDATALIRSKFDPRHILEQDGRTFLHFQYNTREIGDALDVPPAAYDELKLRQLHGAPTHVHVV